MNTQESCSYNDIKGRKKEILNPDVIHEATIGIAGSIKVPNTEVCILKKRERCTEEMGRVTTLQSACVCQQPESVCRHTEALMWAV